MKYIKLLILLLLVSSFVIHKFYVGMFQLNYVEPKKELQITTRLFIDDLNLALEKNYKKKTNLGEPNQSLQDVELLQKYILQKLKISSEGKNFKLQFIDTEIENNVMICYIKVQNISKLKTLSVENSILMEVYASQQNIIQFNNNGIKSSKVLNEDSIVAVFK
jgi:hypothetical protein